MLAAGNDLKVYIRPGSFVRFGGRLGTGDIHKRIPVSVEDQHLASIAGDCWKRINIHHIRGILPADSHWPGTHFLRDIVRVKVHPKHFAFSCRIGN